MDRLDIHRMTKFEEFMAFFFPLIVNGLIVGLALGFLKTSETMTAPGALVLTGLMLFCWGVPLVILPIYQLYIKLMRKRTGKEHFTFRGSNYERSN